MSSPTAPLAATPAKLAWFHEARYGLFIHWGPYAVGGRGEWIMNRERIPRAEYVARYVEPWKAERYDPRAWARLAREAGMRYAVLTTRHHDGFALWDTATTDFSAAKRGPCRDLVRPYVEAMRAEGLRVGLYYSVADWSHPDYPGAFERDWPQAWPDAAARDRFRAYYRAQLRELLTQYGKIDILWYDGVIPDPGEGEAVNRELYALQPELLINDRHGPFCDFVNCEQAIKPAAEGVAWEACMTLGKYGAWGYHGGEVGLYEPRDVLNMLTKTAAGAGNLLLNVGPTPAGEIPEASASVLRTTGTWLARNGEWLYGSTRSPYPWNLVCNQVTTKGSRVYLHMISSPGREVCMADIANPVRAVTLLNTGEPLPFEQRGERLFVRGLPFPLKDPLMTTVAIHVDGVPQPISAQKTFWIPG